VPGAAWDCSAVETTWGIVLATTAGAEAGVSRPIVGSRPMVDPRLCAIGSTRCVNAGTGATCNNELTGVAAAPGTRSATSESTTVGSAATAGCATFDAVASGGVPPGTGSVDAPAG
jgi:hypothetical protein